MTNEKRETAIKWLQNEIRSLRLAPTINGCGPENWADLLEIMETCLEAVRAYPPAHIDWEAWEPCGEMCRNTCMTCGHNADELFGDADYCKDCHHYSKWESTIHKYCERCGRPKTPEAWAELEKRLRG